MPNQNPTQSASRYRTIVADPPWNVRQPPKSFGAKGNAPLPYSTMTVDRIAAMPVEGLAADVAHLYLWTVNRFLRDAYTVVEAWGFRPTMVLTWCKEPRGDGPGWEYSSCTEFVVFAKRGTGSWPRPAIHERRNWWIWPRGQHSVKPGAFFDMVETVSPAPRLELFARRRRLGWDSWGDEVDSDVEMAA